LGEIDRFTALVTGVGTIEFIGENFLGLSAFRTFAAEGLKVLELLESRAVLRGAGHDVLLGCSGDAFKPPATKRHLQPKAMPPATRITGSFCPHPSWNNPVCNRYYL
jgi:hypothetical protein